MSDAAPEFFGSYRVEELLGRGGMGEVHRAFDTVNERYVALKRLAGVADAEFRARFRREARIVAELNAPHVVSIHAHGEIDGRLYLDMKLVEGPDLKRLLADGSLEPVRAIGILTDVAAALDAAHAKGVLHRDVKPANILVDVASGSAYLADFGIARSFAPDVTRLTETGDLVGTLDYMAPERLVRGSGTSHDAMAATSDVYSLACVLFQCLTGRVPFPAADEVGKLAAQLNDPPPAPSLFDRRIPPAMDLVVRTGMDKDPRRRYPTAGELMAAAAAVIDEASTATVVDLPAGADPGRTHFVRLLATVGAWQATAEPPAVHEPTTDALAPGPLAGAVGDRCPYPGLRSFGTGDSEWFFGREQAVRELLARLASQRADSGPLIVVGASGAGKSSLLHAGLLAAHARAVPSAPTLAMTPGERPVGTLAARLAALTHADPQRLAWQLYHRPATFGELCRAAVAGPDVPLVVAVDQAEELFTQCVDVREREAFVAALANAWPARVVLAVRADFVEHCIALAALKRSLATPYLLGPLTAAELAEVVTKPAEAAGLVLEPGLVDRLIIDSGIGTDAGAAGDPGALPRLAHALRETWHNRSGNMLTFKGYQQTGGVDRAVALTADGVYSRFDEPGRWALRWALLRMVTLLDGGGIARRRTHRSELSPVVLESLVAARLVTVDRDHVSLAHDALLTAWPRLREWVAEDRQGLLVRQQLREAVAGWQTGGQDRGDLYRGARLAAALDWAASWYDVTPDERAFLTASERDRRRQTRRLRGLVAGLASLLVLALVAGVVAVLARNDAERESETAQRERDTARSRQLAAESLAQADVDPISAMRKAVEAWRAGPTLEARGAVLSAPSLVHPSALSTGVDNVFTADVNPDGSLVAIGTDDGKAVLWDAEANKRLDVDIPASGLVAVRFSPDGTRLAVSSIDPDAPDSGVRIWEVPSGKEVARLADRYPAIGKPVWRPDGNAVAAVSLRPDDTAWVGEWDPSTGKLIRWAADRAVDVNALAYNTDGDRLAVGHHDGSVELWEPATATRIMSSYAHRDTATVPDFVPVVVAMSAAVLATSSVSDNMIRLWHPRTGALLREIPDTTRHTTSAAQGPAMLAFSADGLVLYTNSRSESVAAWDPQYGTYLGVFAEGPRAGTTTDTAVRQVVVSRDGRTTMAAHRDGTILSWGTNYGWFTPPAGAITGMAFHPAGERVTAGDAEGGLYTWDAASGEQSGVPEHVEGGVFAVQFAKDGTRYTASGTATFTRTAPRGAPTTVTLPGRQFRGPMTVSPDGRWLAAAHEPTNIDEIGEDNRITIWDARTLTQHTELDLDEQLPHTLLFAPDSDTLHAITGSDEDSASALLSWPAPSFTDGRRHALGDDSLYAATFTADGRQLLTAGNGGTIEIRDPTTGRRTGTFGRHPATVRELAISPDGRTLATITTDDTLVRLWDLETHTLLAVLTGHTAPINKLEFSPDGTRLATGGTDTDANLWHTNPDDAATQICANLRNAHVTDLEDIC